MAMCGSRLALNITTLYRELYSTVQYKIVLCSSPRSEDFTTVRTGITVVFNSLVYDLDVPVQVTLLAEHFMTLRAGCRLVYLDVEVDLQDTSTH